MKHTLVLSVLAALLLGACTLQTEPIPAGPIRTGPSEQGDIALPPAPPDVANGEAIYIERCAACHGPEGTGDGPTADQIAEQGGNLPDLTDFDRAQSRSPAFWYQITTNGNIGNLMPPWREALTDQERWDVTYYLYTFARPPGTLAEGQALYEELLAETDDAQAFTDLATMTPLSLADLRDEFVPTEELSEEESWALAWYLLSLPTEQPPPAEAQDQPPADEPDAPTEERTGAGRISGQVTNASGSPLPEDLTVQVIGLRQTEAGTVEEFLVREAPVTADGAYLFADLPFDREQSGYVVSTVYEGVEFTNGLFLEADAPDSIELPLTIYENTTDPAALTIDTYSFAIEEGPQSLQIFEVIQVRNRTDQVYVTQDPVIGGRRGTFRLRLPADATNIQLQGGRIGGRFVQGEGSSIYDTALIPPNGDPVTLTLSYTLPFEGSRDIALPADYSVGQVVVLAGGDLPVQGEGFLNEGPQQVGQNVYTQYRAEGIAAGETILFRVGSPASASLTLSTILGVALVIVVIAAVAYGLVYGPRSAPAPVPDIAEMDTDAATLVAQIAALDAAYTEGDLDRFTYEEQRADLKAQLADSIESKRGA